MIGDFKKTLTITEQERKVISEFMETMEEDLGFDFEENPGDLFEIMNVIWMRAPRAYFTDGKGTMDIKYQDD